MVKKEKMEKDKAFVNACCDALEQVFEVKREHLLEFQIPEYLRLFGGLSVRGEGSMQYVNAKSLHYSITNNGLLELKINGEDMFDTIIYNPEEAVDVAYFLLNAPASMDDVTLQASMPFFDVVEEVYLNLPPNFGNKGEQLLVPWRTLGTLLSRPVFQTLKAHLKNPKGAKAEEELGDLLLPYLNELKPLPQAQKGDLYYHYPSQNLRSKELRKIKEIEQVESTCLVFRVKESHSAMYFADHLTRSEESISILDCLLEEPGDYPYTMLMYPINKLHEINYACLRRQETPVTQIFER